MKNNKRNVRILYGEKFNQEIINIKKILLDYRLKQATKQTIKSHKIKKYKKELAKMITIEHHNLLDKKN